MSVSNARLRLSAYACFAKDSTETKTDVTNRTVKVTMYMPNSYIPNAMGKRKHKNACAIDFFNRIPNMFDTL